MGAKCGIELAGGSPYNRCEGVRIRKGCKHPPPSGIWAMPHPPWNIGYGHGFRALDAGHVSLLTSLHSGEEG